MRIAIPMTILPSAEGLGPPVKATRGAAGFDLCAALPPGDSLVIEPRARALVPTGIRLAIPDGYEGQVRPRSGLALRSGVTVLNSPGTIDSDYRGEVGVILVNHGAEPFVIRRGDRIAQLVIASTVNCLFEPVADLDESQRGDGGFGSTGIGKGEPLE